MASEEASGWISQWQELDPVPGTRGPLRIYRDPSGGILLVDGASGNVTIPRLSLAAVAETLQRAAMPGQPAGVQPPAPLAYDPAIDNCANMPGCGDQRVLFTWFHAPAICCPRCYVNLFGGEPDPASVITIPSAMPGQPGAAGEAVRDGT
jgi:hypothetical protein